jgi:hypothetical protein
MDPANKNRPVLPGGFFLLNGRIYSPLPKRRDHHPARRGWGSDSGAGCSGSGAAGSAWAST